MAADSYDAIVIGAGHNGLVAACYLAKAGLRVLVLERRPVAGGCCVTEEVFPGYRVSTAAYVVSLLQPRIIRELKLAENGFEVLPRDPSSFSPFPDNRHLLFWSDPAKTRQEIARFSADDARRYGEYEAELERVARQVEPLLMEPPPRVSERRWSDLWQLAKSGWRLRSEIEPLIRLFTMSVADYLDRWFKSPELKARLATDGVIGAWAGPATPGTAYVLFHHVMGMAGGQRGVWGYVKGGVGTLIDGLLRYFHGHQGTVVTDAEVSRVVVKNQRVTSVVLQDGREYQAPIVLSNADPQRTFLRMFDPLDLPEPFVNDIAQLRMRSGVVKINVACNGLPDFSAYPGTAAGPQHQGTIHFCPTMEYMQTAFQEARAGSPARQPVVEMCIPSVADPTVAPPGKHLISLFVQYAPYERRDGKTWNAETEREFAERVFAVIRDYAPNWDAIVDDYQILTPKGLEDRFGITGGNIFHGEMTVDQLYFLRPVAAASQYSTPVEGFYLCGAGSHPGGGVMGAAGYLAARRVLKDRG